MLTTMNNSTQFSLGTKYNQFILQYYIVTTITINETVTGDSLFFVTTLSHSKQINDESSKLFSLKTRIERTNYNLFVVLINMY